MPLLVTIDHAPATAPKPGRPPVERLISGDPQLLTWLQDESDEGRIRTGVWEATPGESLSVKGTSFEFCHILSGVVELTEEGGAPQIFRAGDSFVLKPGYVGVWKTIETVRKVFVVVA